MCRLGRGISLLGFLLLRRPGSRLVCWFGEEGEFVCLGAYYEGVSEGGGGGGGHVDLWVVGWCGVLWVLGLGSDLTKKNF